MAEPPPNIDTARGLDSVLERLNGFRRAAQRSAEWTLAEQLVERLFRPSLRLAVYGTLAPGAPNHSVLAEVAGTWSDGWVTGDLTRQGWAATYGYPALRWDPGGERVPVKLFESPDLDQEWDRLDRFEGPGYRRILVPVRRQEELLAVANCYEGIDGE